MVKFLSLLEQPFFRKAVQLFQAPIQLPSRPAIELIGKGQWLRSGGVC